MQMSKLFVHIPPKYIFYDNLITSKIERKLTHVKYNLNLKIVA